MFATKKCAGKHLICDFKDIPSFDLDLKALCKELCEMHHYEILGEVEHVFQPQGYTLLFLLSESHLSVHTFPEKNHMSFDIYTCRQYSDNSEYDKIYKYLIDTLEASEKSACTIVDRCF